MYEQNFLTRAQFEIERTKPMPEQGDLQPPVQDGEYPYFTSWIRQQVVDRLGGGQAGARQAFEGGLRITTTIDGELQQAAEGAINNWLPNRDGPRAALVAIENKTGMVRAMVGGDAYDERPFNLATQGQRQPGSAIKPFILAEALKQGISANSVWASKKLTIDVPHSREVFTVNNYEGAYSGSSTLARATTFSDNSVFAQVGIKVGTRKVARLAERMGIRTQVSHNYAMTLGGLKEGVTPLDMAHAYGTFASGGDLIYGTLSPGADNGRRDTAPGPVGIERITKESDKRKPIDLPNGERAVNRVRKRNVLDRAVAEQVSSLLQGVVRVGTGTHAQVADTVVAGKTGTTEGYGDAWFVGWTPKYTVAVWVGYPDEFKSMETEYQGQPVAGGTFPAAIFQSFISTDLRNNPPKEPKPSETPAAPPTDGTTAPAPTEAPPSDDTGGAAPPPSDPEPEPTEQAPVPTTPPAATPAPGGDEAPDAGVTAPP